VGKELGGCTRLSPHLDWYDGLDDVVAALREELEREWGEVNRVYKYISI
jgi:hypothetical protein